MNHRRLIRLSAADSAVQSDGQVGWTKCSQKVVSRRTGRRTFWYHPRACAGRLGSRAVVLAERLAAQPRQVRGSGDRDVHPTCHVSSVLSASVTSVDVTVSEEMKVLGVVLDHRLSFVSHVTLTAL